jgi:hypothetical protein
MLTHKRLREVLHYDPSTGHFTWLVTNSNRAVAGSRAGTLKTAARNLVYRQIRIDRRGYRANRLAWFYVHGEWPSALVDHINTDGLDDRIENLREATHGQNQHNSRKPGNNTSGFKGVWLDKRRDRWVAEVWFKDQKHFVGQFATPEQAAAARDAVARKLHGKFMRA